MIVHAGLVARRRDGHWCGALIEGPSGVGKSDLALRALGSGFRLVADDRTILWSSGGLLFGKAPTPLAGLVEVRGQGVAPLSPIAQARIVLVVTCVARDQSIERLPDPDTVTLAGVTTPRLKLHALEPSAGLKLAWAIEHLGAAPQQGYQASPLGGWGRAGTGDTP